LISTKNPPLLLGHRGARRIAPENTLTAFDLALTHGCDGFEFDVRSTADQRAIVCHDLTLAGLPIAETTYSAILEKYSAATCLEDVIARYDGRAYLDIELKVPGLEKKLVTLVASLAVNTYVVSSFLPEVLQTIYHLQPTIPLGWICDQEQTLAQWREIPCTVVIPECKLVTQTLIDEIHSARKKIFVWTVNQEEEMLRLGKAGVDAIISDDTGLLGRVFSRLR